MEEEGLKRCLDKLESCALVVDYIVTDRHPQISKVPEGTQHHYDVWHFEKGKNQSIYLLKIKLITGVYSCITIHQ